MKATAVLLAALLWATPAAAQESYDELPTDGRQLVDALEAQEYWGNPNDAKAWIVTLIWVDQVYGLPIDTHGLEWEDFWHTMIRWEQGQVDTSMVDDFGAPSRSERCYELAELKRKYNVGAGVLAHNAAWWGMMGHFIPASNPFLKSIRMRVEFVTGLSTIFSAQLAGIALMIPECITAD